MSSATKTLQLLEYFSPARPEIGLSHLCRLADRDKATTYRHLQSLEKSGFVEQNPMTRHYRLGPALLQLAQTRELTVPRTAGVEAPLRDLADATGETAHASVLSGNVLYKLMAIESPMHSIRVVIDIPTFPLHATASGLCALAFGADDLIDTVRDNLTAFTSNTVIDVSALQTSVERTRITGFGTSHGSYEADVFSLAAPLFGQAGSFAGSISVACVATRFTPDLEHNIKTHLVLASRDISHNWGGTIPAPVEQAWASALMQPKEVDVTS